MKMRKNIKSKKWLNLFVLFVIALGSFAIIKNDTIETYRLVSMSFLFCAFLISITDK